MKSVLVSNPVYNEAIVGGCDACGAAAQESVFTLPVLDGPYCNEKPARKRQFQRCLACGHISVDLYEPNRYTRYYRNLQGEYHSCHDIDCSRYRNILEILQKNRVHRILDVGCGTGTFLNMLPRDVERFGVEPALEASNKARASGISIIGFEDLKTHELSSSFDVITAIDVIEHTKDLSRLRDDFATALRPGGLLILLTGDFDSRPARLLGRHWYYLHYSEHVSFFSARSIKTWLAAAFDDIEIARSDHHPLTFAPREMASLVKMCLAFPVKWIIHQVSQSTSVSYPALWTLGDHMLVKAVRR
jgi:2-polyprenyl-3-methyl-5-hydroxy-6-metoxy-1,4-benzoquinol methylase